MIRSADNHNLEMIKISNDKEIMISASYQGVSKIFFKLKGPATHAENTLSEFKTFIAGASFE